VLKSLVAALMLLAAGVATAGPVFIDAAEYDANGHVISNFTFRSVDGDSTSLRCGTRCVPGIVDTLADADTLGAYRYVIDPDGVPAWLCVEFAQETNAKTAWFKFFEINTSTTPGYAAGNWIPKFLNGEAKTHCFEVGLWDSAWVTVSGSADGIVEFAWITELIR